MKKGEALMKKLKVSDSIYYKRIVWLAAVLEVAYLFYV